jgi:hypothetical protein
VGFFFVQRTAHFLAWRAERQPHVFPTAFRFATAVDLCMMAHQSLPKQHQADNLGLCLKEIMKMFAAGIRSHPKSVVTRA